MLYPSGSFSERPPRTARPPDRFRMVRVSLLAAAIGILAGAVAFALLKTIALLSNLVFYGRVGWQIPPLQGNHLGAWVVVVPALGGVAVALMAKYGTDKIKGHGIPEAMEAVLENRSRIHPKVALLKPISTAVAIGTGGPFGAEGPIIQTGGAVGSLVGQLLRTTAAERKVLLACGAGAGMAATFSTPIAGVVLAIELLLFEFKSRSFVPLVIATTLATSVHMLLLGAGPLFEVAPTDFRVPAGLPWYLLLGVACGLAAVAFTRLLYAVEDLFEALPVDPFWLPAIGGLGLGLIGLVVPRVLGVGYDTITAILNDQLAVGLLLAIAVAKSAALLVSLGSGTSGGLLAPMFMASAALGAALAHGIDALVPGAAVSPAAFALTAMGAVFGAASRATFTFIIFAFEITRDYNAVLPLMLVGVIADLVALKLQRSTIMTEKLERRGLRVHADFEADPLQRVRVREVMDHEPPTLSAELSLGEVLERLSQGDPVLVRHHGIVLTDADGRLAGIVTRGDLLRAVEEGLDESAPVVRAGTEDAVVTHPEATLHEASATMLAADVGRLPVVDPDDPRRVLGYLGRKGILEARRRLHEEEGRAEPGWLGRA